MVPSILLIDDEPDAGILFKQNFRREIKDGQFELIFTESGEEALNFLGDDTPPKAAVVISDVRMPGMSGIDVLKKIKPLWPDLPVIMVTAYGSTDVADEARSVGAEEVFSKPVDFQALGARLKECIDAN